MRSQGAVLVDRNIHELMDGPQPFIKAKPENVQPSSLDLEFGERIWTVSATPSLSEGFNIDRYLEGFALNEVRDRVLMRDTTYLIELAEEFRLHKRLWGYINPKSTSGRSDFHCVVLANGSVEFNHVPLGYEGKLYSIVTPQSFPISDVVGVPFVQMRFYENRRQFLWGIDLPTLHNRHPLVTNTEPVFMEDGLVLHLDLKGNRPGSLVSLRIGKPLSAKSPKGSINPKAYFYEKPLYEGEFLILEPGEFALASTIEVVSVPEDFCVEMVAIMEGLGEFRSHDAGFFDPWFVGTIVCEIRNLSRSPMAFRHGQRIGLCRYERLREVPQKLYAGNYNGQRGVRLAKWFADWDSCPVAA